VINRAVVKRYSKALWLLAENNVEKATQWEEQLKTIVSCVKNHNDLSQLVESPIFSGEQKWVVFNELLKKLQIEETLVRFMNKVTFAGRLNCLAEIYNDFSNFLLTANGGIKVLVESALPISDEELAGVQKVVENRTQKKVSLETSINKELIAGLRIHFQGKTWDNTLKSNLYSLKQTMNLAELR